MIIPCHSDHDLLVDVLPAVRASADAYAEPATVELLVTTISVTPTQERIALTEAQGRSVLRELGAALTTVRRVNRKQR
jgi:hypothetical protein